MAQAFPGATAQLSPARGTLAALSGFQLPLRCAPGASAPQAALEALAHHPDLFRLDVSEWTAQSVLSCTQIDPAGSYVTLVRERAGSVAAADQTVVVRLRSVFQRVSVDLFLGHYLPVAPELELAMGEARGVEDDVLLEAVTSTKLPYSTFSICTPTGEGHWAIEGGDSVTFDKPRWSRLEDATGTTVWERRDATVLLAEAHVTPELLSSDAYCPPRVGWVVTLDSLKGAVVEVKAGVGCVVCLGP